MIKISKELVEKLEDTQWNGKQTWEAAMCRGDKPPAVVAFTSAPTLSSSFRWD